MREVNIAPDWEDITPGLLLIYTDGETGESRRYALAEMLRAARLADGFAELAAAVDGNADPVATLAAIRQRLLAHPAPTVIGGWLADGDR